MKNAHPQLHLTLLIMVLASISGCRFSPPASGTPVPPAAVPTPLPPPTHTMIPSTESNSTATPQLAAFPTSTPEPKPILQTPIIDEGAIPIGARTRLGIGFIISSALSPDGKELAVGTSTGIYAYRIEGFMQMWRKHTEFPVHSVTWSPDGTHLLTGAGYNYDSGLILWNASTGARIRELEGWFKGIWSPDGALIAVAMPPTYSPNSLGGLQIYDGSNGLPLRTLDVTSEFDYDSVAGIEWSPDGQTLAAVSAISGTVHLWNTQSWSLLPLSRAAICGSYLFTTFTSDSTRLITIGCGATTQRLLVVDVEKGELDTGTYANVSASAFALSPDGARLAVIDDPNGPHQDLLVIDIATGKTIYTASDVGFSVDNITWSPDGRRIALETYPSAIVLDATDGTQLQEFQLNIDHLWGWKRNLKEFDWFPDGQRVLISYPQQVRVMDTQIKQELQSFSSFVITDDLAWLPDGSGLILSSPDGYRVWDVAGKRWIQEPLPSNVDVPSLFTSIHVGYKDDVVTSPDGRLDITVMQSASDIDGPYRSESLLRDGQLIIQANSTGEQQVTIDYPNNGITSLTWSPGGDMLAIGQGSSANGLCASGIAGNEITVINPFTGDEYFDFPGHSCNVYALAFSPDGQRLASASGDGTVIIWDTPH